MKSNTAKFDKGLQKWAARLAAVASIIGVLAAGGSWVLSHVDGLFTDKLEQQTATLQQEVQELTERAEERDNHTELQLTRLELMTLMANDPENIVEIEKVARHYFVDLKGDTYMTSMYTKWAKRYGGNIEFVIE